MAYYAAVAAAIFLFVVTAIEVSLIVHLFAGITVINEIRNPPKKNMKKVRKLNCITLSDKRGIDCVLKKK